MALGFEFEERQKLFARANLIEYLSRAMGTPAAIITKILDDEDYILTVGFAKKMIEVHDRRLCGVSTIIEGETGVGKSELLRMYSLIVNAKESRQSIITQALEDLYGGIMSILPPEFLSADGVHENCQKSTQGKEKSLAKLLHNHFFVPEWLESLPVTHEQIQDSLTLLHDQLIQFVRDYPSFNVNIDAAGAYGHPSLNLLAQIESGRQHPVFYKLGVYGEQTLAFVEDWLDQISTLAHKLQSAHGDNAPVLTVFFDELNTSSCMSVYKEIMVDRRLNSVPLPDNLFFVAAINPLRSAAPVELGAAVAGSDEDDLEEKDGVPSSSIARNNLDQYLVRDLPASMHHLKWKWGALKDSALMDYTSLKLRKVFKKVSKSQDALSGPESSVLTSLVIAAHNWTRDVALESSVSQRDVQRCFNLWGWLISEMPTLWSACNCAACQEASKRYIETDRRKWAMIVAISLTYYACRTPELREALARKMSDNIGRRPDMQLEEVYRREVNFFLKHTKVPAGIARTPALAENIFILVISIVNKMPVLILGEVCLIMS